MLDIALHVIFWILEVLAALFSGRFEKRKQSLEFERDTVASPWAEPSRPFTS